MQMPSDLDDFFEFEKSVDERLSKSKLWEKPLRSVLSNFVLIADTAFSGGRFGKAKSPSFDKGGTILSRTSYLMHFMKGTTAQFGSSLNNALNALDESDYIDTASCLMYGHFCELVPFVRNKYLGVEKVEDGFKLFHASEIFAYDEQRDIVASELSLTMLERRAPFNVIALSRMVDEWPYLRSEDLITVLEEAFAFYMSMVIEDEYIEAQSYRDAFSFEREEFLRVRAALMAFASWCIGMAAGAEAKAITTGSDRAEHWREECLEWSAPLLKTTFIFETVQGLSGVDADQTKEIFKYFTNAPLEGLIVSGDGYFAPLTKIDDCLLISPRALLNMTAERNLLYVKNRTDRKSFDNLVSQHLEPALLQKAEMALRNVSGLLIAKNVQWAEGEIDLLAYDTATNTVLQLQAKAAIPPQGARMTRQIEQNTSRAVQQLIAVEKLDHKQRHEILMRALGVDQPKAQWTSAVLSRSSFGTSSAWTDIAHRGALNLFVLRKIIRDYRKGDSLDLSCIPSAAFRLFGEAIQASSNGWEEKYINLFGTKIYYPNLELDNRTLARMIKAEDRPL